MAVTRKAVRRYLGTNELPRFLNVQERSIDWSLFMETQLGAGVSDLRRLLCNSIDMIRDFFF